MPRELGRCLGVAFAIALPATVVLAAMYGFDVVQSGTAIVACVAALAVAVLTALSFAFSLDAIRRRVERHEPDAPADGSATPLVAHELWAAVTRRQASSHARLTQAEARVAAAEAVIAAIADPLLLIDHRRRVVRANSAAAELIGTVAEPRDLAGALRNPVLLSAVDSLLRGEAVRSAEFSLSVPVERVLRAHLARVDGPALDGAVAILTLHDVTTLKRSEQMRADFIANAGHELKTPLATLIGFIETLLGPARKDATARERFLGIMHQQAGRMARLVDDLLSLSRIELNEHVAPTGRVALAPVIEEVARGLELRAAERGIRIAYVLPAELPEVQGDRDELTQIFQNLLDNAVKYGRRDGQITVSGEIVEVASGPQVRVSVADQGEGIPPEHLPRLTERFYRLDTARSRELGGTGLGLAIVKHLVNRHRGRLEIASKLGQGSTFSVCLRAVPQAPTALSSNGHTSVIRAS
jgi:two-component system phosphate regulon sensor histidine kinase PhoR